MLKRFIFIILAFLPAISSAEDIFELVTKNEQINGCWERINFSPKVMKKMNKVESFPWEYQVYCFNDEGKLWSVCSNRDLVESDGKAFIQATFNNIIITVTNRAGQVISWASAGKAGFKGSKKNTPYAAQLAAQNAARAAQDKEHP